MVIYKLFEPKSKPQWACHTSDHLPSTRDDELPPPTPDDEFKKNTC